MNALTDFDFAGELQLVPKTRRPSVTWLVVGAILVAMIGLGTVSYFMNSSTVQSTDDAVLQADLMPLVSRMAGRVDKVLMREHAQVQQGNLVILIDQRDASIRLQAANGAIDGIRAGRSSNQAHADEAISAVEQERAALLAKESEHKYLSAEVDRYRGLVAKGAEPSEKLAKLVAERDRAVALVSAARAAISAAAARAAGVRTQDGELNAKAGIALADRDAVLIDLERARMVAPISGRLSSLVVQEGQYVQVGQILGAIVPLDKAYVVANFKETQIARLRPGQPARVYLDAAPDVVIPGIVESLAPGTKASKALLPPQNASGNFTRIVQRLPVRIRIKPPAEIRPLFANGLSASVEIDTVPIRRAAERH